jgi:hypothetical protein
MKGKEIRMPCIHKKEGWNKFKNEFGKSGD